MKNNRRISAFSLIEISIVILIIGILVAGVTQSSRLLTQAKLSSAKTMTQSSPVASIKNLSLWIESTSDLSFQSSDLDDGTAITTWNDINPQTVTKANLTTGTSPTYKTNIINGLPAVLFDGSTTFLTTANFSNISTNSTVFAVVRLPSTLAAQPIFSKRPSAAFGSSAPNIQLSTSTTGWQYCDAAAVSTSGTVCNYSVDPTSAPATSSNYVVSIVYNTSSTAVASETSTGLALFQNGVAQTKVTTTTSPNTSVTDNFFLGKDGTTSPAFFGGHIGELIIFDRALKREERQSIETYLGKKWGITMTTASY